MMTSNKSLVIEFDNVVVDGSQLLFDVATAKFKSLDIKFDVMSEARYLIGYESLEGISAFFKAIKTKRTAPKAERELAVDYVNALAAAIPVALTKAFINFLEVMTAHGVKVVLLTKVPLAQAMALLAPVMGEMVSVVENRSPLYGATDWVSWRRACHLGNLDAKRCMVVAGSGMSLKSAMMGALSASAVIHPHVEYQDFGGACLMVDALTGQTAKRFLKTMRIS